MRTIVGTRFGLGLGLLACLPLAEAPAEARAKDQAAVAEKATVAEKTATRSAAPGAVPGGARQTLPLSLADAVFVGLRKNTTIRSAYIDRVAQLFNLKVSEDIFTPKFRVDASAVRAAQGNKITDTAALSPSAQLLTPVGTTFGFVWDNAVGRSGQQRSYGSTLSATFAQPLLKGAGLEVNLAPIQSARLAERVNQLNLKSLVSTTITDIITGYRALLTSQESLKLAEESVVRAQAILEVNETLIQAGRMARTEIVQTQADLENQRLNVLQAQNQVDQSRLALAAILDLDLSTNIVIRDKLNVARVAVVFEDALQIALKCRPDYAIQFAAQEQARLGLLIADNQRLPDLSLVGAGAISRAAQTTTGLPSVKSRAVDGSIGMRLSAPLNDLSLEQGYVSATTSLKNAEIQLAVTRRTVEQQIRQSVVSVDLTWRQVEAARRVEALAASAVDIEKQKLAVGRSSTFQVQSLESSYRFSKAQVLNAELSYVNALTALDLQLGTTLDTWKIALRTTDY